MDAREYLHMFEQEESHWWYSGMRAIVLSLLTPAALPENPRVLDAGCGTGYSLGWLRERYRARVVGIDWSPYGLDLCRKRGEPDIMRGDVAALPLLSEVFDLAVACDVLSEVNDEPSRAAAMREFLRVLKPGGKLLVRVPAYEWLRSSHDEGVSTRHRYGRRELRDRLADAGFQPLRTTFANTILFPVAVIWRLLKKAGLATAGSDVRPATRGTGWMNRMLASMLKTEGALLCRTNFAFGLSLLAVAAKPQSCSPAHHPNSASESLSASGS